jgi:hypothetical protein
MTHDETVALDSRNRLDRCQPTRPSHEMLHRSWFCCRSPHLANISSHVASIRIGLPHMRIEDGARSGGMSPGAIQVWFHRLYNDELGFKGASSHRRSRGPAS